MNYYRQLLDYICNITPHECTNTSAKVHSPNILVQKNKYAPIHFSQGNHPPLALGPPGGNINDALDDAAKLSPRAGHGPRTITPDARPGD